MLTGQDGGGVSPSLTAEKTEHSKWSFRLAENFGKKSFGNKFKGTIGLLTLSISIVIQAAIKSETVRLPRQKTYIEKTSRYKTLFALDACFCF